MLKVILFGFNCSAFGFCAALAVAELIDGQVPDALVDIMFALANAAIAIINAGSIRPKAGDAHA